MSNYLMSNFIHMNEMEIEAVNLTVNINACALQNAADIVQRQTEMKGQDRRRRGQQTRPKSKWTKAWLKRCTQLGWYDTLLKELASEEEKDYFNFMRMNKEFFDEILAKLGLKLRKKFCSHNSIHKSIQNSNAHLLEMQKDINHSPLL